MGRSPCCYHSGVTKGHWLPEEDTKLKDYILKHGHVNWKTLPQLAGLNRCSKSCRLRWTNYLDPDVKRGNFSEEEEKQIIQLHSVLGNKWATIAKRFKGRTDNEIKNYWNTHLRKKLLREGIDPVTHKPQPDLALLNLLSTVNLTNLSTSTPLDINALKLQTEVAQLAKIQLLQSLIQMLSTCSSITSSMNSNNYKNGIIGSTPLTNYQLPNNLSNSNTHQFQDFGLHDQTINGTTILQQPYSNNNLDVNHIMHGFGDSNPNGLFQVDPTHNTISSSCHTNLAFTNYQNLSEQYLEGLPQGFCEPVKFCVVGNNKSISNSYSHHRHSSPCSTSFVSCSPEMPNWNTTPANSSSTGSTHEPCGGEGNLEDIFGYF